MSKRQSPTASEGSAKRSRSLSAQIAALVDPTPRDRDDMDDAHAEFTQIDEGINYGEEDGEDVHSRMAPSGRLRIQAGIDDDDEKYAGRVAQLSGASSDDESDEAQLIGREESDDKEGEEESEEESEDSDDDEESDEDDVSGELDDGDSGIMFQRELEQLQQEEQQVLAGISTVNHDEVERAGAVREQTKLWTDLLELRIAVQGCLTNANRMPKDVTFERFASDTLVSQKLEEAQKLAMDTVNDLHILTTHLSTINQDEDDEPFECESVDDLWSSISGQHNAVRSWQAEQISWWGRKTMAARQLQGGKAFQSLAKDAMEQVKEVMSDMPRLLKRTHLKRSEYKILGDIPTPKSNDAEEQRDSHLNQHDPEVFDDTDFYERLLQELIDTGSQASLQAAITGRTEVKKSKHQVDTRASKGRKIRYHVHQKLANFMYATGFQMPPVTEELFSRLFGQQKQDAN